MAERINEGDKWKLISKFAHEDVLRWGIKPTQEAEQVRRELIDLRAKGKLSNKQISYLDRLGEIDAFGDNEF